MRHHGRYQGLFELLACASRYRLLGEAVPSNKEKYAWSYDAPMTSVYAPKFIKMMSDRAPENTFVTCDVGQHQMWVAQHYAFPAPHNHLTSGGLGTMGFGLPAAMGVKFAYPDANVVVVSGDGSIMMNIQELATLKRYNIPIKIVLFDNHALGMVRQWQELFSRKIIAKWIFPTIRIL